MTPEKIFFLLVAAVTLAAGLLVVTRRNLVHAALWLVVALFGVAVTFATLQASFLAVAQVVIYIGAIAILMIFAIMLTRNVAADNRPHLNANWPWAAALAVGLLAFLGWMLSRWQGFNVTMPDWPEGIDPLNRLGQALASPNYYVLPFELASLLLVAALIGSILVAWERGR